MTTANFPVEMHTHTILGELDMYITFRLNVVVPLSRVGGLDA